MARTDYNAKVTYSKLELTAREKIAIKDFETATKLNDIIKAEPIILPIKNVVKVEVHNEHSQQNKDYSVFIIVTEDNKTYRTGSESFFDSYVDIIDELADMGEDTSVVKFKLYKQSSKNFDGDFIKASLAE